MLENIVLFDSKTQDFTE